jgi:hypothetical protein
MTSISLRTSRCPPQVRPGHQLLLDEAKPQAEIRSGVFPLEVLQGGEEFPSPGLDLHNPSNERIKRQYFVFLAEAKRLGEPIVDAVAKALHRFEVYTAYRDFKTFHVQQAVAFKKHLAGQKGQRSGETLSKATLYATLAALKRFFQWLAGQPGYKSRIQYLDADSHHLPGGICGRRPALLQPAQLS